MLKDKVLSLEMKGHEKTLAEWLENEKLYRKLVEFSPVPMLVQQEGRFVYVNAEAVNLFKAPEVDSLMGKGFFDFVHSDDHFLIRSAIQESGEASGEKQTADFRMVRFDGRVIYVEMTAIPFMFGGQKALLAICIDRTEHHKEDAVVLNNLAFMETLLDTIPNPIFYKDKEGTYVGCNDFFARTVLGLPREKIIGRSVFDFPKIIPVDLAKIYYEHDIQLFESPGIQVYESKVNCADGRLRDFLFYKATYNDSDNTVAGIVGVMLDITELKAAESSLHKYQNQLRTLSSKLTLSDEEDRQRIATDLHEQIGQTLAISKIKLAALRQSTSSSQMAGALDEIRGLIEQTINNTRKLTFELSPPVLRELGLRAAVEWLIENFSKQHDIQIDFQDDDKSKPLDSAIRLLLFKATRELLFNVAIHSDASHASVFLGREDKNVLIKVTDNGIGFDFCQIDESCTSNQGLGLFGIRERMNHLGGSLDIDTKPGQGTSVTLVSPMHYHRFVNTK